jgi:hypothetical protein
MVATAREHGLLLEGLGTYNLGPQRHDPALVVGYPSPEQAFSIAIARLCAVLAA